MMKLPTNSATPANTIRKVLMNPMPSSSEELAASDCSARVRTSYSLPRAVLSASSSSVWLTPSAALTLTPV